MRDNDRKASVALPYFTTGQ